ncbi:hypothetical protein Cgig2_026794 [Carnegiea gigantea]|uniref:GDSL esterase/lipase n=1 Tax=Carnegiea gigantea TaxID=171969 RepID=A0A9Q1JMC9_9CARY|nr:hypothetical protein Cgig2_026794 [Carnegiea gigantea]
MAEKSHLSFFISLIATLLLGPGLSPVRAKVPALIVFGDSSVDTGNNNGIQTVLKSNFEPYGQDFEGGRPTGRFSNGRVTPDFLSEYCGLKKTLPAYLDPSYKIADFATGVVFASAGTGYDNTTASVLNVIPFWKQIQYYMEYRDRLRKYLGDQKAKETVSEAVYIISIGTNDFLENYYVLPTTRLQYGTVQQFEDHLVGVAKKFIENIYSLGARKISLGGLPPMGCLPLERTINFLAVSECNEEYNNVAVEFNGKLKGLVDQLNKEMPGIRVVFSNPYYIMMQMIKRPSLYGEFNSCFCH